MIAVGLHHLGPGRHGGWCPTCNLPSAVEAVGATEFAGKPYGVRRWWWCIHCRKSWELKTSET